MCEPSPVRKVLARFSVGQIESARQVSLERSQNARSAGDRASADLFAKVADECSQELEDRLLTIAARSVVDESQKADREARDLLIQMTR